MQLSILIVNYNTESYIEKLLLDLKKQTLLANGYEIIITNNVQNNLLEMTIQNNCELNSLNIQIVQSDKNLGFGRAMNLAATHAKGDHLLIANPDLRMIQNDYLSSLLHHAESNPKYGLITTQLINDDNIDKSEGYTFEFNETCGYKDKIAWFSGALLLIRKQVMQQIKGFDPDFFMYCEDEDLCLRIKKIGLELIKINSLKIYHKGGSSEPYRNYDYFCRLYRSQILFANKHFSTDHFNQTINKINKISIFKTEIYKILMLCIPTKRHKFQFAQWSAMRDVTNKTLKESVDWLYFKI
ncbi:glycosyltransferase family 2 protein [Acinetobacter towneri]|uniref:glycosyltransferase family 2 protein n=1 Tax=Acinetobacter towneri TaxID=202956 RepID=UPI0014445EE7|nr:glycosyltransferase family 2 protein [Acinetobacter towneri]